MYVVHEPECPFVGRDSLTDCLFCNDLRSPNERTRKKVLKNIDSYLADKTIHIHYH